MKIYQTISIIYLGKKNAKLVRPMCVEKHSKQYKTMQ